jgi:AcrR family transcriptional regulator
VPRISDATRASRRQRILIAAWVCFARNGFQATSIDDVIAASGMSSSAVYRYFRSKDEIIEATVEVGLARLRDRFRAMLEQPTRPTPAEAVALIAGPIQAMSSGTEPDMTRIAMLSWAEVLRRPPLRERSRALCGEALDHATALASQWLQDGHVRSGSDPRAVATALFTLIQGMIVWHHLIDDVVVDDLLRGLAALGAAVADGSPTAKRAPPSGHGAPPPNDLSTPGAAKRSPEQI